MKRVWIVLETSNFIEKPKAEMGDGSRVQRWKVEVVRAVDSVLQRSFTFFF